MLVLLAGGLVVIAALVLSLPWGRRDPAGFSAADVGYVRGGPVGAVLAVLGVLYVEGLVQVRGGRRGFRRTLLPLPAAAEPLARAVHVALASPARLRTILGQWGVRRAVEASATTVAAARVRTAEWQRLLGTVAAFAAVVVAGVAVFVDGVVGILAFVVSLGGAVLLWRGRFVTVAGRRLLAEVRRSAVIEPPAPPERRVWREKELVHADTRLDPHPAIFAHPAVHLGIAAGVEERRDGNDWPTDLFCPTGYTTDSGTDGGSGDSGGHSDGGDSGY